MRFLSDVLPSPTGAIDLGSTALRWAGIYGVNSDMTGVATAAYVRATATLSAANITEVIGVARELVSGGTATVWKIASMPLDNDTGNLTALALDMECEEWSVGSYPGKTHLDIKLSSRGTPVGSGPKVVYNVRGTHLPLQVGIKVYRVSTSGPYNVYAYLTGGTYCGFNVRARTYGFGYKATLYENPANEAPTPAGTLVWDSATAPADSTILGLTAATAVISVGGKQLAGVTGNGSLNRLTKWASGGSAELVSSSLLDSGAVVNCDVPLSVTGAINATGSITAVGYLRSITNVTPGHGGLVLSSNTTGLSFIDFMKTAASQFRWRLFQTGTAENADGLDTGNVGTDFSLESYGATSSFLRRIFLVTRSTGFMRIGNTSVPATVMLDVTGGIGASLGVTALGLVTGAGLRDTTLLSKAAIGTDSSGRLVESTLSDIGGVGGSGTLNYLARWTGTGTTLGIGTTQDNGTSVFMGLASAIGGTVSPTLRVDQYASRAAYAAITYGLNVNTTDDDTTPVATQRYIAAFNYTKSGSAANTGQSLGISQYSTISAGSDGSHTGFYQTTNISPGAALTGIVRQFYADRNYTSYTTGTRGSVVTRYGFFNNDFNAGGHLTVTNNFCFFASDQTACTNIYGFSSQISAGTNKWGLYFSGTAQNYLQGNLGLGIAVATEKLDVLGNAKVTGDVNVFRTNSGGGASITLSAFNGAYSTVNFSRNDGTTHRWRWKWYMYQDTDAGVTAAYSASSNLRLYRYRDDGTGDANSLSAEVARATGAWNFFANPTFNSVPLLSGAGTADYLPRFSLGGSSLEDSGVMDDDNALTVNRRLRTRNPSLTANVALSDSQCEWYHHSISTDESKWLKIATFDPGANTYGTAGSKLILEVHCGEYQSLERTTYHIEMGDRSTGSNNPMRYYVHAEGAVRDTGSGVQVYAVGAAAPYTYHIYIYSTWNQHTATVVTAKNTGYYRYQATLFPNPAVEVTTTPPYRTERPAGTLDFDTATCQLNWSCFGYTPGAIGASLAPPFNTVVLSQFNVKGDITASESLNVTASTGSLLKVGPSFIGTAVSWIAQPLRIKGNLILHDLTTPANYGDFAPSTGGGVALTFVGLAAAFSVVGTIKGAGLIDDSLKNASLVGTNSIGRLETRTLASAGAIGGSGTAGTLPIFLTGGVTIGNSKVVQGTDTLTFNSANANALLTIDCNAVGGVASYAINKAGTLMWSLSSPNDNDFYLRGYPGGTLTNVFRAGLSTAVVDFYVTPTVAGIPVVTVNPPFTAGTATYLPRWAPGGKTLEDSFVRDDGLNITLGRNSTVNGFLVAQSVVSRALAATDALVSIESDAAYSSTVRFKARRPTLYDSWIIGRDATDKFIVNYFRTSDGLYDWQPFLIDGAAKTVSLRGAVTLDSLLTGTAIDVAGDIDATNMEATSTMEAGYRLIAPSVICGGTLGSPGSCIFGTEGFQWAVGTSVRFSVTSNGVLQLACPTANLGGLSVGLQGVSAPGASNSVALVYQNTDPVSGTVPYTAWFLQNSLRRFGVNLNGDLLMSGAANTGAGVELELPSNATGGFFWLNAMAAAPTASCVPVPARESGVANPAAVPLLYCNADDSIYARRNGTWTRLGAPPANNLTGTGSSPFSARWTGANTLANGIIQDNGTSVGIGVAPGTNSSLYLVQSWPNSTAGEYYTVRATGTFTNAFAGTDTAFKQVYRADMVLSHTTGVSVGVGISSAASFLSYNQATGVGGKTGLFVGYYSGGLISSGAVVDNRYAFQVANISDPGLGLAINYGFVASDLSAVTRAAGFYSAVNATANRYGLYFEGTAQSYFGGSVGIKKTVPTVELDVVGAQRLTGIFTSTLAGNSTGPVYVGTSPPFVVTSKDFVANLNADLWDGLDESVYSTAVRSGFGMIGGGVLTVNASFGVSWNSRIMALGDGRGAHTSTLGYYDIIFPVVGSLVVGYGGAPNFTVTQTVAAGGTIPLGAWESLYYQLPDPNSSSTSKDANFRLTSIGSNFVVPYNWVLIARRESGGAVMWFNKERLTANQTCYTTVGQRVVGTLNTIPVFTGIGVTIGDSRLLQGAVGDSLTFKSVNSNSLLTLDTTGTGGTVSYAISKDASLLWSLTSLGDSSFSLRRWLGGTPTDVFSVAHANGGVIAVNRNTYFIGEAGTNSEVFINSEPNKSGYLNFSRTGVGVYWALRHDAAAPAASPLILTRGAVETWRVGTDGVMVFANTPKVGVTDVALVGHTHSYQPLDGDLTSIAGQTSTGYLRRTGTDAWTLDAGTSGAGIFLRKSVTWSLSSNLSAANSIGTEVVTVPGYTPADNDTILLSNVAGTTSIGSAGIYCIYAFRSAGNVQLALICRDGGVAATTSFSAMFTVFRAIV